MDTKEIATSFSVMAQTINAHIALAEKAADRPSCNCVHFECADGVLHIVSTNGKVMLHTTTTPGDLSASFAFDVRAMVKVNAKRAVVTDGVAQFAVAGGFLRSGDLIAEIADRGFPAWRAAIPQGMDRLESETEWRTLDPKYYALAVNFVGVDNCRPFRVAGATDGAVIFAGENCVSGFQEANMAAVMPLRGK